MSYHHRMELPSDSAIAAVVRSYGRVIARQPGALKARPMVLPNGTFFPDTYTGDEGSLERLVKRMQQHAGLDHLGIETAIAEKAGCSCESGGCGGGGCGGGCDNCTCDEEQKKVPRLVRTEGGFRINVIDQELDTPEILAVQIARSLGAAWVLGKDHDTVPAGLGDLAAVGLGFGALLLEGSYVYRKGCHGASVARFTELGCPELAIAFSLFVAMGRHPERRARGALGTTQRAVFADAMV
jgi:hypothetical protein